jgi:hypothetical protein
MSTPFSEHIHPYPAPCREARRLLILVICVSLLFILAIAADISLRTAHQDEAARAWVTALTLSAPALRPAGDPRRHPETRHPGVDVRFAPGLAGPP